MHKPALLLGRVCASGKLSSAREGAGALVSGFIFAGCFWGLIVAGAILTN